MMRSVKVAVPKLLASVSDEKAIRVCQFSESGKLLALGTNSSKLKIFDVEDLYKTKLPKHDLEPIYEINNFHQKSVFSIDWSAN
jgi:WD40 repeat protein